MPVPRQGNGLLSWQCPFAGGDLARCVDHDLVSAIRHVRWPRSTTRRCATVAQRLRVEEANKMLAQGIGYGFVRNCTLYIYTNMIHKVVYAIDNRAFPALLSMFMPSPLHFCSLVPRLLRSGTRNWTCTYMRREPGIFLTWETLKGREGIEMYAEVRK